MFTKSIKIQNNKILTYNIVKSGFKSITRSILVNGNQVINERMISSASGSEPYIAAQSGLLNIAKFVDYFTPSGNASFTSDGITINNSDYGLKCAEIKTYTASLGVVSFLEFGEYVFCNKIGLTQDNQQHSYTLTCNGDDTWTLKEGETTIATDTLANFGLSITESASNGDIISLGSAYYNRFVVFVVTDTSYQTNKQWGNYGTDTALPNYSSNPQNAVESATYCNKLLLKNYTFGSDTAFEYMNSKGIFLLPDGIKLKCVIPNGNELQKIFNIKDDLGINWGSFSHSRIWSCVEGNSDGSWKLDSNGSWGGDNKYNSNGCVPIFEVPVM